MTFEKLGFFVSNALNLAQRHAKELGRGPGLAGASVAVESIPGQVSASLSDVSGKQAARLVMTFGELNLAFLIDPALIQKLADRFSGPVSAKRDQSRLILHLKSGKNIIELKLPNHGQEIAPLEVSTLPIKWAPYVGFITVLWGDFETRMDELTGRLATINTTTLPQKWKIQDFGRR